MFDASFMVCHFRAMPPLRAAFATPLRRDMLMRLRAAAIDFAADAIRARWRGADTQHAMLAPVAAIDDTLRHFSFFFAFAAFAAAAFRFRF